MVNVNVNGILHWLGALELVSWCMYVFLLGTFCLLGLLYLLRLLYLLDELLDVLYLLCVLYLFCVLYLLGMHYLASHQKRQKITPVLQVISWYTLLAWR